MLMHEKLMAGQFFDLKTDRKPLLHHHQYQHHQTHHQQQSLHHLPHSQLPVQGSLGLPKMDLYAAYAYQQQLLGAVVSQQQQQQQQQQQHQHQQHAPPAEVLDLSRRCDSVETPRKTPSPYQTSYSYGSGSPSASPTSSLLYAAQMQQQQQQQQQHQQQQQQQQQLASLYPAFYYSNIKQEQPTPAPAPPKVTPTASLLQTFAAASAAAAAAAAASSTHSPRPASNASTMQIDVLENPQSPAVEATTPTTSSGGEAGKNTRPFKAFPRDPLVIAANFAATDVLLDNPRVERYTEYRKRVLEQIRSSNGGSRTVTNPKMRRTNSRSGSVNEGSSSNNNSESEDRAAAEESSDCDSQAGNFEGKSNASNSISAANTAGTNPGVNSGSQVKDAAYYERRRKNNAAAKKSRDRRRIKEDEIAIRAAYLERQNIELLCQIDALKAQLAAFTSAKVSTA
ncbi:protein giant [Drosophila ficusphila]|uniref:protein giant n=1 Tax=Drosophila ficusphila TaxID=30025 RepID=UPI0007E748A5|nr:protein giant [Drosophila ficusphila]